MKCLRSEEVNPKSIKLNHIEQVQNINLISIAALTAVCGLRYENQKPKKKKKIVATLWQTFCAQSPIFSQQSFVGQSKCGYVVSKQTVKIYAKKEKTSPKQK